MTKFDRLISLHVIMCLYSCHHDSYTIQSCDKHCNQHNHDRTDCTQVLQVLWHCCWSLSLSTYKAWVFSIQSQYVAVPNRNPSVVYFECINEFVVLVCWASAKGGAHRRCVNARMSMKLSTIVQQTRWCAWNTGWNNIRFLSGTAIYMVTNWVLWEVVINIGDAY